MANPDSRLIGLDVLRCLAASLVIIGHANNFGNAVKIFENTRGGFGEVLQILSSGGWVAVHVFFVLSGFLVSGLLFKEATQTGSLSIFRFLIRRGFKIYPAFWIMLACFIVWTIVCGGSISLRAVCAELFYFQNYGHYICFHTWSLAVEEHFYFILAGWFFILKWRAGPNRPINFSKIPNIFIGVAVLCLLLRSITWWVVLGVTAQNSFWFKRADHAVIDALFFGVLLSYYWHNCWSEQVKKRIISLRLPFAFAGLCLLLPGFIPILNIDLFRIFGFMLLYLGAGCLLLSSFSLDYGYCPVFLKWLAWSGKYSYSVYLWHLLAGYSLFPLVDTGLDTRLGWALDALIYFALCWIVGIILARLIEFPALRMRDRWFPSLCKR
jgi:peptidoglycan/LPS O-acetylase OafA/YrhL